MTFNAAFKLGYDLQEPMPLLTVYLKKPLEFLMRLSYNSYYKD